MRKFSILMGTAVVSAIILVAVLATATLAQGTGPVNMGPGMMGGWGFGPFGWIGMIFMWLIPVGLVVIAGLGIAWLVRSIGGAGGPISPTRTCPNCGRTAQADWRTCPFCGHGLP